MDRQAAGRSMWPARPVQGAARTPFQSFAPPRILTSAIGCRTTRFVCNQAARTAAIWPIISAARRAFSLTLPVTQRDSVHRLSRCRASPDRRMSALIAATEPTCGRGRRRPKPLALARTVRGMCARSRGHDGLHKYPGHDRYRAGRAHDGRNAGNVIGRPNNRSPSRRSERPGLSRRSPGEPRRSRLFCTPTPGLGVDCGRGSVRSDCCPSRATGKDRCCGGPFRRALQNRALKKEPPDVCPVSRIGHLCGNLHRAGLTGPAARGTAARP
jgi:hypothetical protein